MIIMELNTLMKHVDNMVTLNRKQFGEYIEKWYEETESYDIKLVEEFVTHMLDGRNSYGIKEKKYDSVEPTLDDEFNKLTIIELLDFLKENNTGTNEIVSKVKGYITTLPEDYQEFVKLMVTRELKIGYSASSYNKIIGKELIFNIKPMKSVAYDKAVDKYKGKDVTATLKADGIRLMVVSSPEGISMLLRSGQAVDNFHHLEQVYKGLPYGFYDGEVIIKDRKGKNSKEVRQLTSSIVRNENADKTQLEHLVFDGLPLEHFLAKESDLTFLERRQRLEEIVNVTEDINLVEVVYSGNNFTEIAYKLLDKYTDKGEEGLMININDSVYKFGVTQEMAKFKKSYPIDLRVVSVYEGKSASTKGVMGGVIVHYKGNEVQVGGGWSDDERVKYWNNPEEIIGKIIEIRHDGESTNSKTKLASLSYPRKIAVRFDKDEESYN